MIECPPKQGFDFLKEVVVTRMSNEFGCRDYNVSKVSKGGVVMKRLCFVFVCLAVMLSTAVSFAYERRVGLGVSAGACMLSGADDKLPDFQERAKSLMVE